MHKKYNQIIKHYEDCFIRNGDSCKGVNWPNEADASLRYKVMLDLINIDSCNKISLLDFGCGAAHLYDYIKNNKLVNIIDYSGLDLSERFVSFCKQKHPDVQFFHLDVLKESIDSIPAHDFIIMNGVFTEKRELTQEEMWDYFKALVTTVFSITNKGIAFNLMSKYVEWERDDLFHVGLDQVSEFIVTNISRNFVIRNDYGLYEYTVYIYKQPNK